MVLICVYDESAYRQSWKSVHGGVDDLSQLCGGGRTVIKNNKVTRFDHYNCELKRDNSK